MWSTSNFRIINQTLSRWQEAKTYCDYLKSWTVIVKNHKEGKETWDILRSLITRDFRPWKSVLESIGAKRIAFIITGHLLLHPSFATVMNRQFHISVASASTIADSVHAPYWGGFFLFKALVPHGFLPFLIFFFFAFILHFLHFCIAILFLHSSNKLLDESERGEWKSWLKAKHSEN